MGPHQGRVEGQENLPRPAGHTPPNASQDAIGLLGSQGTLLAHGQPVVDQMIFKGPFQPKPFCDSLYRFSFHPVERTNAFCGAFSCFSSSESLTGAAFLGVPKFWFYGV